MSIASEITKLNTNLTNAYTAVSNKGGTLPANRNFDNLSTAINSITGGSLPTIMAVATDSTKTASANDKVLLQLTADGYIPNPLTGSRNATDANDAAPTKGFKGRLLNNKEMCLFGGAYNTIKFIVCKFNDTLDAITNTTAYDTSLSSYYTYVRDYAYNDGFAYVTSDNVYSQDNWFVKSFGYITESGYVSLWDQDFRSLYLCRVGDAVYTNQGAFVLDKVNLKVTTWSTYGYGSPSYITYHNGNYYKVTNGSVTTVNNQATEYTNTALGKPERSYTYQIVHGPWAHPIDRWGNYYIYMKSDSTWAIMKLDKSTNAWVERNLSQPTSVFRSAFKSSTGDYLNYSNKDYGDYVEMFFSDYTCNYPEGGNGNNLAHFIFHKNTETLERLPDVFSDIPSEFDYISSYVVNWDLGLIGALFWNSNSKQTVPYVKNYKGSYYGMYKYYALPVNESFYTNGLLTGFVKENKGTNTMEDTILEVKAIEDPSTPPWTNIGKIFGMDFIVDEGAI